jgi:group I intron endonuclease
MNHSMLPSEYKYIGVYVITNILNNKQYVGSTTRGFYIRYNAYKNAYSQNINKKLKNSIIKNNLKNFIFSIVEVTSAEEVREREEFYIKKFNTVQNGYNVRYTGQGGNGGANRGKKYPSPSLEVIQKRAVGISAALKGRTRTKEHCAAISKSKKGCLPPHSLFVCLKSIITGDIICFNSATEAAKKLSCSISQICSLIRYKSKLLKREYIIHHH